MNEHEMKSIVDPKLSQPCGGLLKDAPPTTPRLHLAPFQKSAALSLRPAPNGGWVVRCYEAHRGGFEDLLGAFSSTKDMMEALSDALLGWKVEATS